MGGGGGGSKGGGSKKKKKTAVQKAAEARHAKFKQTKVQTFGGKRPDGSYSKAEQKRIQAAGYSVKGYSKASPNAGSGYTGTSGVTTGSTRYGGKSETQKMVDRDNQMYGNTFPSGSIGISEAGKQQAAANRASYQAANRTAASGAFNISPEGQAQAAANRAEAQRIADAQAASRERDRRIAEAQAASRERDRQIAEAKAAAERENARIRAEAERKRKAEIARKAEEKRQREFDPGRLFANTKLPLPGGITNPLNAFTPEGRATMLSGYADAAVDGINLGKNLLTGFQAKDKFNVPKLPKFNEAGMQTLRNVSSVGLPLGQAAANLGRFKVADEIGKMTVSNAAFKAGKIPQLTKTGISNVNPFTIAKAFTPGMLKTGPTAGATVALNTAMTGANLTNQAKAGGLNIGGGSSAQTGGGEEEGNRTSRIINDIGDAINTYKGIFNDASAIRNTIAERTQPRFADFRVNADEQAALNEANDFSPDPADVRSDIKSLFGTGMNYKDVANTVSDARAVVEGGAEAFKNLSKSDQQNLVTSAGGIIDNSKVFESFGQKYTGAKDFKDQTQATLAAANKTLQEASQDTEGRVDPINNLLKNFNKTPGYDTTSRLLRTFEDPNIVSTRQRLQAAYDPTSPKADALSFSDRGLVGSAGNLLIGGKLSDVFRANNPTERGTTFTPTDSANLIANTMIAAKTPGSLTQQRFSEIGRLTGQGTRITPGTLIRGSLPQLSRGGTSNKLDSRGGSGPSNVTKFNTATPEGLVPQAYNFGQDQSGVNPETLSNIQKNAYNTALDSYGVELQQPTEGGTQFTPEQIRRFSMDPEYFAQFRQRPRKGTRGSFRKAFIRKYF